jgi:Putative Actinobacterial Holin-X, holin superfamily III
MTPVTSPQRNTSPYRSGDGLPPVASIPLTDDDPAADGQSIGNLVRDATAHLSTLVRAEVELARAEITAEVKKGLTGSVFFIVALVVLLLAFPFLFTAAALGIDKGLWDWAQPWGGFAIIFLAMLVIAALFGLLGFRKVKRIRGPRRTISSVRDTAAALSRRHDADQPGDH